MDIKLEKYSQEELKILFGVPTRLSNDLLKKGSFTDAELANLLYQDTFSTFKKNKQTFCSKLIISVDNSYKNIWDILILFIIAYNTVTLAY